MVLIIRAKKQWTRKASIVIHLSSNDKFSMKKKASVYLEKAKIGHVGARYLDYFPNGKRKFVKIRTPLRVGKCR